MSKILANQWRPQAFSEVIGQSSTVTALINALDQSLLHHCYLFSGTRGVGKTSLARLFAQGLNCAVSMSSNPCKRCDSCMGIKNGDDLDCYEIDAASRTKVEETLKILEMANYPPTRSKFKIFLIDEVHMLSNHSFNALLKTLEQPPSYVKFLLATTEPSRIPDTVRSRCIQFKLQPVKPDILSAHILKVAKESKKVITPDAVELLVQVANGSVRDAMTSLQHILLQSNDDTIKLDLVENVLGLVPAIELEKLKDIIFTNNDKEAIQWCEKLSETQFSWSKLLDQWLMYLNEIMWQSLKDENSVLQNWIQIALLAKKDLALYPDAKMAFQVMVARSIHFVPKAPGDWMSGLEVDDQFSQIKKHSNTNSLLQDKKKTVADDANKIVKEDVLKPSVMPINPVQKPEKSLSDQTDLVFTNENWPAIVQKMNFTGMTNQLLQHMVFVSLESKIALFNISNDKASLCNDKAIKAIEKRLSEIGYDLKLTVEIGLNSKNKNVSQINIDQRANAFKEKKEKLESSDDFNRIRAILDAEIIS